MKTISNKCFIPMLMLLLGMFFLGTSGAVWAESASDAAATPAENDAEALMDHLVDLHKQVVGYRAGVKNSDGEEQSAIFLQLITAEEDLRDSLDELVGLLGKGGQEELLAKMKRYVADQSKSVQGDIEAANRALAKLYKVKQDELSVGEMEELSRSVSGLGNYLDVMYEAGYQNIERQKMLELDYAADLKKLKKSLSERAELLAGLVQLAWRNITYTENRINRLPASEAGARVESLQSDLFVLEEKQRGAAESLAATVDLMDKAGLDTSKYRLLLIQVTGEVGEHIFDGEVFVGLMGKLYDKALDWIAEHGPGVLVKILVALIILLIAKMVAAVAGRVVRKALSKSHLALSALLQDFFVSMASKLVMLIGLLIVLSQFGVEIGPALAGLGVVGFIVGFALQETLSNFASGLMILIYRPFDVGDLVEVAGTTGRVRLMSLVSTTIVTLDNQRLVVPNTKIWGDVIRNVTAEEKRRIDMVFGIGYEDDIADAEKIMKEIVSSHPLVLKQPEPDVKLHTLGESSVDFVVRPWVRTDDYWTVYWDVTRAIKEQFDAMGISIPYPQRDVHMYQIPANPPPMENTAKPD